MIIRNLNTKTMDEIKHTYGPWFIQSETEDKIMVGPANDYNLISINTKRYDPEEANANAKLIAAAPDLLEACKNLIATKPDTLERYVAWAAIKHAVNLATITPYEP